MKPEIVFAVIEAVVFLIPLFTVFYKMGKLAAKINENEENLRELKKARDAENENSKIEKSLIINGINDLKIRFAKLETTIELKFADGAK